MGPERLGVAGGVVEGSGPGEEGGAATMRGRADRADVTYNDLGCASFLLCVRPTPMGSPVGPESLGKGLSAVVLGPFPWP